jgi:cation diffusion facilitator family transporter
VSILADALNNLSDAGSSVVSWLGFRLAEKPADEHHPYGHARYEYLSALAVAVMILFIGFELAKSSVEKILSPQEIRFSVSTAAILLISIGVKLGLFVLNRKFGLIIGSGTLLATAADSRNDCLATGAVLLTGIVGRFTHVRLDGWAGLGVALFICLSGWNMARDTISPLLGENADPELQERIAGALRSSEKVLGYHDLMVHDYGPGQRFASVHVEMDTREDPLTCHAIIDGIERECLKQHRVHLVIHYDPVVTDDAERNEARREVELVLRSIHPDIQFHDFRLIREADVTRLCFDMILPHSLRDAGDRVKRQLDTALNLRRDRRYETDITFDQPGFSGGESWG